MGQRPVDRRRTAEQRIAGRIEHERVGREWSYGELARRMTEAGQPMNTTAIIRTLNPKAEQSRRRITADEIDAYSRVLELPLSELFTPPDKMVGDAQRQELAASAEQLRDALSGFVDIAQRLSDQLAEPELKRTAHKVDKDVNRLLTDSSATLLGPVVEMLNTDMRNAKQDGLTFQDVLREEAEGRDNA